MRILVHTGQGYYAQADTLEEAIAVFSSVASSLIELYLGENIPILLKFSSTLAVL
jgi:hypothetical protein